MKTMKVLAPELGKVCIEIINCKTELGDMSSVPDNITVKRSKTGATSQFEPLSASL